MKAVTWHGRRDVRVESGPDPRIEEVLGPFLDEGDILGHEPIGIVLEVSSEVRQIDPGDRVVIPFNIPCGHC